MLADRVEPHRDPGDHGQGAAAGAGGATRVVVAGGGHLGLQPVIHRASGAGRHRAALGAGTAQQVVAEIVLATGVLEGTGQWYR